MDKRNHATNTRTAPLFPTAALPAYSNSIPSSSLAFSTPVHPIRKSKAPQSSKPSILPILLPPATLRPLAFRTFTKKNSLTLTSSALQAISTFIGKHCGSGWLEEGLAEIVLDDVAKSWKKNGGGVIVPGEGDKLKSILRDLERSMSGGRPSHPLGVSRLGALPFGDNDEDITDSTSIRGADNREENGTGLR